MKKNRLIQSRFFSLSILPPYLIFTIAIFKAILYICYAPNALNESG